MADLIMNVSMGLWIGLVIVLSGLTASLDEKDVSLIWVRVLSTIIVALTFFTVGVYTSVDYI